MIVLCGCSQSTTDSKKPGVCYCLPGNTSILAFRYWLEQALADVVSPGRWVSPLQDWKVKLKLSHLKGSGHAPHRRVDNLLGRVQIQGARDSSSNCLRHSLNTSLPYPGCTAPGDQTTKLRRGRWAQEQGGETCKRRQCCHYYSVRKTWHRCAVPRKRQSKCGK